MKGRIRWWVLWLVMAGAQGTFFGSLAENLGQGSALELFLPGGVGAGNLHFGGSVAEVEQVLYYCTYM